MKKVLKSTVKQTFLVASILTLSVLIVAFFSIKMYLASIIPATTQKETTLVTGTPTVTLPPNITPVIGKTDTVAPTADGKAMQYTSTDLGITFAYSKVGVVIERKDNRVYVAQIPFSSQKVTDGQYVEVFTKDKTKTLTQTLQATYLQNKNPKECFITDRTKNYGNRFPKDYEIKTIEAPVPANFDDWSSYVDRCPKPYTINNGAVMFITSSTRKDRYAFLSIGQYSIPADETSEKNDWSQTFRFIAQ